MPSLRNPVGQSGKKPPTELEKARAEAERAKADVRAAQERAEAARAKLQKSTRDAKVRLRITAVLMMTAALLKLGWQAAHDDTPSPLASAIQPMTKSASSTPEGNNPEHPGTQHAATEQALEGLRDAFQAFPEEDQPNVIREVNEKYAGTEYACPLQWKDGRPALTLDGKSQPMMAKALDQCAAGVQRLRKEKDAENARLVK